MNIVFKNSQSPKNMVNKTFSETTLSLSGNLKAECSVQNPIILIENNEFLNYNYAYIQEFGRCYFVTDVIIVRKNLYEVHLKVDVLYNFSLLKEPYMAECIRCENIPTQYDTYENVECIVDRESLLLPSVEHTIVNFPKGFEHTGRYFLTTAGGSQ